MASKMRRCTDSSPSFIKFLLDDDFSKQIRIPPDFTNQIREFSKKWVLKTDLSSKTWHVKVDHKGDYYYVYKRSWPDFAKTHELKFGDSLIFRYIGVSDADLSTFKVLLFSVNGLPKVIDTSDIESETESESSYRVEKQTETFTPSVVSARPKRKMQEKTNRDPQLNRNSKSQTTKRAKPMDNVQVKTEEICDSEVELERVEEIKSDSKDGTFQLVFKHSTLRRMNLPLAVAKRIYAKKIKQVFLINESGRKWEVGLWTAEDGTERVQLGKGWAAFRDNNNLKLGDEYNFTLLKNEENMILIKKISHLIQVFGVEKTDG